MFQHFSLAHVVYLLRATEWTLLLSAVALVFGGIFGAIVALLRISAYSPLRWLARAYIYVVQGTPLLVLLFIAYFGLADLGLDLPPLVAAGVGFTLYASAFLGEIWRGSIEAVGRGQWEGSGALGPAPPRVSVLAPSFTTTLTRRTPVVFQSPVGAKWTPPDGSADSTPRPSSMPALMTTRRGWSPPTSRGRPCRPW